MELSASPTIFRKLVTPSRMHVILRNYKGICYKKRQEGVSSGSNLCDIADLYRKSSTSAYLSSVRNNTRVYQSQDITYPLFLTADLQGMVLLRVLTQ